MDAKLKDLWLKALRSRKYRQAENALKDGDGYCCLGLLCHVAAGAGLVPSNAKVEEADATLVYHWTADDFPEAENGELPDGAFGLPYSIILEAMSRNDGTDVFEGANQSFPQIADWLETALPVSP